MDGYLPDQKTMLLESLLLRVAHTAATHNKKYYIGGGFAIDLACGGISRPHDDVDFYPLEADALWWKELFNEQEYITSVDTDMVPLLYAFLMSQQKMSATGIEALADVYPVAAGSNGDISMAVRPGTTEVWDGMLAIQNGRGIWPGKTWQIVRSIEYKGQQVSVEDCRAVLAQKEAYIRLHLGEKLGAKHIHDYRRVGATLPD